MKLFMYMRTLATGRGDTERAASELANEMSRRGHKVYLAYAGDSSGKPAYDMSSSVGLIPLERGPGMMDQACDIASRLSPHILLGFYSSPLVFESVYLHYHTEIPLILQECSSPERIIRKNWTQPYESTEIAALEREAATAAACRIQVAIPEYEDFFPDYIKANVRSFPHAYQIPHGLNQQSKADRKRIISISDDTSNKNIMVLLQAFKLINSSCPDYDIHLFRAIPHGEEAINEIKQFIAENRLSERIFLNDPVDDLHAEYAKSQIHVTTSLSESLPRCVAEAMLHGIPTVSFADSTGAGALVKHGVNGLLASPDDRIHNLAAELEKLMHDNELRADLGAEALKGSAAFDPDSVYRQWESLFEEAAAYGGDQRRLISEQMDINKDRALRALQLRPMMVHKYLKFRKMFQ